MICFKTSIYLIFIEPMKIWFVLSFFCCLVIILVQHTFCCSIDVFKLSFSDWLDVELIWLCKRNKVVHNYSQVFIISSLKEIGEWFEMKPVFFVAFPLNLVCLFSWIWVAQCFLQGWGVKMQWLFFANQFIQPLSQKVWSSCRGQRNQCFPYQESLHGRSMVFGPLDWILRVASCTSVGFPFASA